MNPMETPFAAPDEQPEPALRVSARLSAQSRLSPEELSRTIVEVRTAAEDEQARLSHPLSRTEVWYRRRGIAVALLMAAAMVWTVQLWIWKPEIRPPNPREKEGGMRFQIALQAASIEDFRDRMKRLPRTLAETDEAIRGMRYTVLDSIHYRLTMGDSSLTLSWRSDSSLAGFLGSTLLQLRETKLK